MFALCGFYAEVSDALERRVDVLPLEVCRMNCDIPDLIDYCRSILAEQEAR